MSYLLLSSLQSLQQPIIVPKPHEYTDNNFVHTNLSFLTKDGKLKDSEMNDNSITE
jgi:hypothetical protein